MSRKLIIHHLSFIIRKSRGFTLVELLASVIVLVAVGSVIAGIMTSTLRGTNKTNTIENIRQNGNYTLAQISKNIEYAAVFGGLSPDGITYITSCPSSQVTPTPSPVITQYQYIKIITLNGSPTIYNCTGSTLTVSILNGTTPTPTPLMDTNSFDLIGCSLSCTQTNSTDIPIIKIGFTLKPKNLNNLVENSNPPIVFETSVTIRNYKK